MGIGAVCILGAMVFAFVMKKKADNMKKEVKLRLIRNEVRREL